MVRIAADHSFCQKSFKFYAGLEKKNSLLKEHTII